jgi:uncharacterized protein YukE
VTSSATESELISKLNSVLDRIEGKTTDLQNSINGKMKWLPPGLQDSVRSGWNAFCAKLQDIWNFWKDVFTHMGSPSALSDTADAWSSLVGGPVSAQVQTADAGLLGVDDKWDGDAADAYRQTLPTQKTALEKIKTPLVDGISSALADVSNGIITFWVGLGVALAALVAGLIGALSSAATIFGLPAAPFIAAGAAAIACTAVITGGMLLESRCRNASTTLRQRIEDNSGFHDEHWPPAARY